MPREPYRQQTSERALAEVTAPAGDGDSALCLYRDRVVARAGDGSERTLAIDGSLAAGIERRRNELWLLGLTLPGLAWGLADWLVPSLSVAGAALVFGGVVLATLSLVAWGASGQRVLRVGTTRGSLELPVDEPDARHTAFLTQLRRTAPPR